MNKKIFSVLLVAVITASYVQAQFTFGARAGFSPTNVSLKYDGKKPEGDVKPKYKPGFQIGVVGEYGISDNFAIQPGILFATQGYKMGPSEILVEDVVVAWLRVTVNINYLQIPVYAQYKMDLGSSALLLQAGPYIGYAFGGKINSEFSYRPDGTDFGGEKTDLKFGSKEDQISPFDFGLGLGVGLQIDAIQFGLRYQHGLANLYNIEKMTMNNRGFAITASYFFGK